MQLVAFLREAQQEPVVRRKAVQLTTHHVHLSISLQLRVCALALPRRGMLRILLGAEGRLRLGMSSILGRRLSLLRNLGQRIATLQLLQ
jgi:hypothetical protein